VPNKKNRIQKNVYKVNLLSELLVSLVKMLSIQDISMVTSVRFLSLQSHV